MADRISQIAMTAHRVAPTGVGVWQSTPRTGPSTSVVVAPADLAYLIERARSAERAEVRVRELDAKQRATWDLAQERAREIFRLQGEKARLRERFVNLADEWAAWGRALLLSAAADAYPRHHERGMTYIVVSTRVREIAKEENDD